MVTARLCCVFPLVSLFPSTGCPTDVYTSFRGAMGFSCARRRRFAREACRFDPGIKQSMERDCRGRPGQRASVTFERLYKEGSDWKSSSGFGRGELLVLAKVADQAHSRIFELVAEDGGAEVRTGSAD